MSERAGSDVAITIGARASFEREVAGRFGVMPNFFCSASAAPGLIQELWAFAKSAFLDNPLPSLFKERLFVHLSRFCEVRYCIIRHVGFLIGKGRPAGDPKVRPETIEQVITLLQRPLPDAKALEEVFARLESHEEPRDIPAPGTQAEYDLFDALTVMFLEPLRWERAREAVRRAFGNGTFEVLTALLAFVRTAHFWTETHPELAIEPDMLSVLEKRQELARLLLDPSEAERVKAGEALRQTLAKLEDVNASLRVSDETLELALQSAGQFAWEVDRDTRNIKVTGDPSSAFGFDLARTEEERFARVHPEDLPRVTDAYEAMLAGKGPYEIEHRLINPTTGETVWAHWTGRLVTESGRAKLVGITRNITATKNAELKISTLAREAEHRAKNLLANVKAMVRLSQSDTSTGLKDAIEGRIEALASVHSLFTQSRWTGAELGSVVKQELSPYFRDGEMRTWIDGPPAILKPDLAQAIAVALHELATNAAKFGALSAAKGQVRVEWSRAADGRLVLRWTEAGGPPVNPPTHKGFGTHVMEAMIRGHAGGDVRLDWRAEGLACEIVLPM
jgi:PAS domain S-box-containing protein